MKKIIFLLFPLTIWAQAGTYNPSFSGDGLAPLPSADAQAYATHVQPDNKILVAGKSIQSSYYKWAVARFNIDGSLDTSFNHTGYLENLCCASFQNDDARVIRSTSNAIYIAGKSSYSMGESYLVKLNYDGSKEMSFGSSAFAYIEQPLVNRHWINHLIVQDDGKIVVTGKFNSDFLIARFTAEGILDTSFSINGILEVNFDGEDEGFEIYQLSDGSYVATGLSDSSGTVAMAVCKITSSGLVDLTFGNAGRVKRYIPSESIRQTGQSVLMPDESFYFTGSLGASANDRCFVARLLPNGGFDTSFYSAGYRIFDLSAGGENALDIISQGDGLIIVSGQTYEAPYYKAFLLRLNCQGELDNTFNGTGVSTFNLGTGDDEFRGMSFNDNNQYLFLAANVNGAGNTFMAGSYITAPWNASGCGLSMEEEFFGEVQLYPNPGFGEFWIDLPDMIKTCSVTVTDLCGKRVDHIMMTDISFSTIKKFRLINQTSGIYIINIELNGYTISKKYVLQF